MNLVKKVLTFGLLGLPLAAGAVSSLDDLIDLTGDILNKIVPLIIAIAVIILLIAIIGYIRAGEDEEKRKNYHNLIIYAIIGLFVMVSVWGLVNILEGTFNLDNDLPDIDVLPQI
ncbi:MAG: hypothetical protein L6Q29_00500 [Candidatus Pacebacteria bacterium]|nr:hypothetical protein [Candidatus Paceibacterota bacterium]NUQ57026.1 hypothetical protein [Candidatus Paceibacter sp.]